jgi:hypothetical protein
MVRQHQTSDAPCPSGYLEIPDSMLRIARNDVRCQASRILVQA